MLLQSCSGMDESFDERTRFTKEQLEGGIALNFSEEAFAKITAKRNEALVANHHFKDGDDYVPVILSCDTDTFKIKVRLKGDEVDHLSGEVWSYKLKGKSNLGFGQKKMVIQSPDTKSYLLEYLFNKLCKQEGVVALDYFFLPVTINNTVTSSYAMATVVGNQTMKNTGRDEGPVLKFDEKEYWKRFEYFLHPLLDDVVFQKQVESYLKVYCTEDYVKTIFSDNHTEIN
jgi:hypothetical protein